MLVVVLRISYYLFLLEWAVVFCVFQEICPFHLSWWPYWLQVVHNMSYYSCHVCRICSNGPSLVFDLVICIFSLLFLISLTKGLSICWSQRTNFLLYEFFSIFCFFFFFLFLIFIISLLPFILHFNLFSFSTFLRLMFRSLIWELLF